MLQTGGPNASDKSHTELTWSLRDNFAVAKREAQEQEQQEHEHDGQSHQSWLSYSSDEKTIYIPRLDFSNRGERSG